MKKTGTIYKIENLVNGKVYVGQTVKNVQRRMQCHIVKLNGNYHNNIHLQNAWNKYGEKNFKFSIIEHCPIDIIDDREIFWINFYKKKCGVYNIEGGGNYRKIITSETKKRLSEAGKAAYKNPKILAKRREQWRKARGKHHHNNKPVICLNDNKIFYSITAAAEYYNIHICSISDSLRGRKPYTFSNDRKTRLEFEYYEEGKEYAPKHHINGHCKQVICITTNEIFESITSASRKYNIPTTNISKVCKGQRKYAGKLEDGTKLTWKYV